MEEAIVLVIALEPERIEMHVERVTHLCVLSLRLWAEEDIRRPTTATNQNSATVHAKETPSPWRRFRRDLANAERQTLSVRHASACHEFERQVVKLRLAQLCRPPESRVCESKLRKTVGREAHQRAVARRECDGPAETDTSDAPPQNSSDRVRREIPETRHDRQLGAPKRRCIDLAYYCRIPHDDVAARAQVRRLP